MPTSLTKRLGLAVSVQSGALDLVPKLQGLCSLSLAGFLDPSPYHTPLHFGTPDSPGLTEGTQRRSCRL